MEYKYRLLQNANGQFLLQRKLFLIWEGLTAWHTWDFLAGRSSPELFHSEENALAWLNKLKKREQESKTLETNTKTIVKSIVLVPEKEGE